jgi:hypothetical protein
MPDTDSYDPTAGNEQLNQAAQKTADQAKIQAAQNQGQGKKSGAEAASPVEKGLKSLAGATLGFLEKGGTIHKTGPYTLHAGEEVLPKGRASEYRKVFKQRGQDGKHKYGN